MTGSVMQVMRPLGGFIPPSMATASLAAAAPISCRSLFFRTSIPPVPSMNEWYISLLPASAATVEATRRRRTSSQSRSAPSELTTAVLLISSTYAALVFTTLSEVRWAASSSLAMDSLSSTGTSEGCTFTRAG